MSLAIKPLRFRPAARADIRRELAWYRQEAGEAVARRLLDAIRQVEQLLPAQPGMGSPRLGLLLGVPALRACALTGFPLSLWYLERADHLDVVRLVSHRQDPSAAWAEDSA